MSNLPSVTKILSILKDNYSMVNPGVLANAQARGSAVHLACTNYAGSLWTYLPSEYGGYFLSFKNWFDQYALETFAAEEYFEDKALGYCGHPDLVLRLKGDHFPSLWDLKTPVTHFKKWRLQLAAYKRLVSLELKIGRIGSIRLDPNGGKPTLKEYTGTYEQDIGIFLSLLNVYRFVEGGK